MNPLPALAVGRKLDDDLATILTTVGAIAEAASAMNVLVRNLCEEEEGELLPCEGAEKCCRGSSSHNELLLVSPGEIVAAADTTATVTATNEVSLTCDTAWVLD
mmetsp:Transcript_26566/g.44928  ORF Transcript_26566/g.44928 Transcript_26566/m.44928 type:complete len:104 (+) Transcript_26566:3462-3773(+)